MWHVSTYLPRTPYNHLFIKNTREGRVWFYIDFQGRLHSGRPLSWEHAVECARVYGYLPEGIDDA